MHVLRASGPLAHMRAAGVDLTAVRRAQAPTGLAAVSTDRHGGNHIVVAPGANLDAREEQVDDTYLDSGAVLLVQMETSIAETSALIRRARSRGRPGSLESRSGSSHRARRPAAA